MIGFILNAVDTHWLGSRATNVGYESMIAIGIVVAISVVVGLIVGVITSGRDK